MQINIPVGAQLSGHFRLRVGRPGETPRVDTDWFDNLILDAGLTRIMGNADFLNSCQLGTGNSTATAGQTQLDARIAGQVATATATGNSGSAPYYAWSRRTYAFAMGAVVGNVSEVGVGWSATALAALFCRARVEVGGVPTTISVATDESITVIYELRLYPQAADSTAVVSATGGVDGVARTWTTRGLAVSTNSSTVGWVAGAAVLDPTATTPAGAYTGSLGAATAAAPGGTLLGTTSSVVFAVTGPGTGTITATFGAGVATGLVKSWRLLTDACAWQAETDVAYDKTATRRLVLTMKVTVTRRP